MLFEKVAPPPLVASMLASIRRGDAPGTYPVAQALVFSTLGPSEVDAFALHQYCLVSMRLGAPPRLLKVGCLDAQAVLFAINGEAGASYARVARSSLDDMSAYAPAMDVLAAMHVQANVRMFMN